LRRRGHEPAVLEPTGQPVRTFREVAVEADQLAEILGGFKSGCVIAVQIGNDLRWPALTLALFRRGLIPLPLGRHVEAMELQDVLQTCHAAALLTVIDGNLRVQRIGQSDAPPWSGPRPDFLKLTSGTTSAPRGVRFRAEQLVADCDNICRSMGFDDRDMNFGVIPFSHSYGFSNLITPLLCRGVSLVASEDRIPRAIVSGLATSGATVFPGMPIFFDKLASLENVPALPRLRLCISAGAPLTRAVAERFRNRFALKIHTFYGSSECGGIAYDRSPDAIWDDGFVGTPMDGVQIERTEGDCGRITVRGAAVGDGYFPDPESDTLSGGAFRPGDIIRWEDDDRMWIAGRVSEVINVAGRKLNPGEIEARVQSHPGVKQAVVFGVPSTLRGEEPVLCVAGAHLDVPGLAQFCRMNLSEWQVPRDIWIVPEIPVNERGKISRRLLAEQYQASRTSTVHPAK
jgi:long-chain acyl-CoA synthetase